MRLRCPGASSWGLWMYQEGREKRNEMCAIQPPPQVPGRRRLYLHFLIYFSYELYILRKWSAERLRGWSSLHTFWAPGNLYSSLKNHFKLPLPDLLGVRTYTSTTTRFMTAWVRIPASQLPKCDSLRESIKLCSFIVLNYKKDMTLIIPLSLNAFED